MARRGQQRFQKREREKARREKAEAKAARKAERRDADDGPHDEGALLDEFRRLSEQHAARQIGDGEFTERRREILDQLGIDVE
jgi:hypothetical protein